MVREHRVTHIGDGIDTTNYTDSWKGQLSWGLGVRCETGSWYWAWAILARS